MGRRGASIDKSRIQCTVRRSNRHRALRMSKLIRNPTGLELVEETTLVEFREWTIELLGGRLNDLPQVAVDAVNNSKSMLAPLLNLMQPGDQLWRCRSEKRGPLYGHEGVALVRDGREHARPPPS